MNRTNTNKEVSQYLKIKHKMPAQAIDINAQWHAMANFIVVTSKEMHVGLLTLLAMIRNIGVMSS
jgi:hypothetical protein